MGAHGRMTATRRLLKVIVQPVFVDDDGTALGPEIVADPIIVAAGEWPAFVEEFPAAIAKACAREPDAGQD